MKLIKQTVFKLNKSFLSIKHLLNHSNSSLYKQDENNQSDETTDEVEILEIINSFMIGIKDTLANHIKIQKDFNQIKKDSKINTTKFLDQPTTLLKIKLKSFKNLKQM